jgi:hypothetical protein
MKGLAMYASLGGGSADDLIARSAPSGQTDRLSFAGAVTRFGSG